MSYISATDEIMYAPCFLRLVGIGHCYVIPNEVRNRELVLIASFPPKLRSRIFRVQLREFAHQFLRALIAQMRDVNLHLDDLISTNAILRRRRHSLFTHAQFLPALRARWNLQLGATVDGRHFNLRAKGGFTDGHRNRDMNVVSLPVEHRMLLNPYDDEQIARRAATSAGVAFARDAYALAIARARFDSNFERLSNADQALSVAVGTLIHDLAGSMTSWACHVELHAPAGLGY